MEIQGLLQDARGGTIRRAGRDQASPYRKLARKYHPDVSQEKDDERARRRKLGEAYEALKDPEKRKAYDQLRQGGWRQGDNFQPPPGWQRPCFQAVTGGFRS